MIRIGLIPVIAVIGSYASDSAGQRDAITTVIAEFNAAVRVNDSDRLLRLFTKDADYRVGTSPPVPAVTGIRETPAKRLPWDERTRLTMKMQGLRFVRSDVAIADALQSDYSPMLGTSRNWSCIFVLVQVGPDWKIASYRESLVVESGSHPNATPARGDGIP